MRSLSRRAFALASAGIAIAPYAKAQRRAVRIGVLTDETGPYADSGGLGSVLSAQMAAHDIGNTVLGRSIEIVHADHQNKPDVAAAIARRWYDAEGVDAIVDLPVTAIALAVLQVARERNKTVMITAAATSDITAKYCAPTSTHWADDTHALTAGTALEVLNSGAKNWFFITVDHTFGLALQRDATAVIEQQGGRVLGAARHAIGATDYGSQIISAQTSGADAIGLASVGNDLINLIKQASEFGLLRPGGPTIVGFLTYITDIHALGLPVARGLTFSAGFYWDQNQQSRAFAQRFFAVRKAMPTKNQAVIYTATRHFLHAMQQAASDDPLAVARAMKALPVDYHGRPAHVRSDGRVIYDLTLYRVKEPQQSRAPWDYYEALRTVPAAEAFLPVNKAICG